MIAGIILAAGASRRMGTPKAVLTYQGETFLARLTRVFGAICDPLIVVLGYHADTLRAHVNASSLLAINPDPDRGQLSSLQTGLAMIPPDAEGFCFIPVDCPSVQEATVAKLKDSFVHRAGKLLVIPRYGERRGHPVFADVSLSAELLALPATGQAKDVVRSHVDRTLYIDVDDPGVLADIDDPQAYRELIGERA